MSGNGSGSRRIHRPVSAPPPGVRDRLHPYERIRGQGPLGALPGGGRNAANRMVAGIVEPEGRGKRLFLGHEGFDPG